MTKKKSTQMKYRIALTGFLCSLFILSCNNYKEAPAFPVIETEFKQPVSKSFEFSEPDTLVWTTKETNSLNRLPNKKFSWKKYI